MPKNSSNSRFWCCCGRNYFNLLVNLTSKFKYKGEWFEQARYNERFESADAKCVKAIYGDRDATSISVNNTELVPEKNGTYKFSSISGKGVQVDVSQNIF